MSRFKAILFLGLFLFSTVATYASAHHCDGELKDIAILSMASCDHEELAEVHKHDKPCCQHDNHEVKLDENKPCCSDNCGDEQKGCCETEELTLVKTILTQPSSTVELPELAKIHPSFYDFYFENVKILKRTYGIAYTDPFYDRDICIEVQCFRI